MLLVQAATAGQCRVDGGAWQNVYNGSVTATVNVRVTPGAGVIVLDGYLLECRYTPGGAGNYPGNTDYWFLTNGGVTPGAKFGSYNVGLRIGDVDYPAPVYTSLLIATMPNDQVGVDLKVYMYVNSKGVPGKPIDIRSGDTMGVLNFYQDNNTGDPPSYVKVYIEAGNDLFFEPSTCTINNNVQLDVDFMDVGPATIGTNPNSSAIKQDKALLYSCPDPGIDATITMTLKGTTASFNSNFLATSNPNIGVALLRGGVVVRPEFFFTTSITNSVGSDVVTFALVRKTGSFPAAGAFTGSATLVMGVP